MWKVDRMLFYGETSVATTGHSAYSMREYANEQVSGVE
jgi:hypothetical protein